jgi:hypothetical protein
MISVKCAHASVRPIPRHFLRVRDQVSLVYKTTGKFLSKASEVIHKCSVFDGTSLADWQTLFCIVEMRSKHFLAQTRTLVHSGPQGVFADESPLSSRPPRCITFVLPKNDKGATSSGVDQSGLSVSPPMEGLVDYRDWMQVALRLDRLLIIQNLIARGYWERGASPPLSSALESGSMAILSCP